MTSRGVMMGVEGADMGGGGVTIAIEGVTMARRGGDVGAVGRWLMVLWAKAAAVVVVAVAVDGCAPLALAVLGRLRWMLGIGGIRGSAMNGGRDMVLTAVKEVGDPGAGVAPVVVW